MRGILLFFIIIVVHSYALSPMRQVDNFTRYWEQQKVYEDRETQRNIKAPIYTELKTLPVTTSLNGSSSCIQIDTINTDEITLIDKKELLALTNPYLGKCNTMNALNALVKKINNIYIEKAYITSMAYIKPQDLSTGTLRISAMQSKIESVSGDNVSVALIEPFMQDRYLNLRELEVSIEQLNRLQSQQATMAINPGTQVGYSKIMMKGKQVGSPIHGTLGVNNYGTSKSGEFQFSGALSWDNPLGINDILRINLNTTNKQNKENNSLGNSISYALPVGRSYLEFIYSKFNYDQIVDGLVVDYNTRGGSENFQTKLEYKLFHAKEQRAKLDFSLIRKKNENYLQDVFLATSSNKLTIFQLAYTHNYMAQTWDGYVALKYNRGLTWFGASTPEAYEPTFNKYTLDVSFNKKLDGKGLKANYNFSFYGQYAKAGIAPSEQIGIGGPYSVRGFRSEDQISGNKGFYIRNELSFPVSLKKGAFNPYLGLDYGVVSHNRYSYGGNILGFIFGARANIHGTFIDLYYSVPIVDSNEVTTRPNGDIIRKDLHSFTGLNISYSF